MDRKFKLGQRVSLSRSGIFSPTPGFYRIVRLLPPEAGEHQYRVKSDNEVHERVVNETQIVSA